MLPIILTVVGIVVAVFACYRSFLRGMSVAEAEIDALPQDARDALWPASYGASIPRYHVRRDVQRGLDTASGILGAIATVASIF